MKKGCIITNIAPHYRESIYSMMDKELDCDFYIGIISNSDVETLNPVILNKYRDTLSAKKIFHAFYWQKNAVKIAFKNYDYFIINGDPHCLSSWVTLLICLIRKKKRIIWSHGFYGREYGLSKILKVIFFKLYSHYLIYNSRGVELTIKSGFSKDRVFCIANSLNYESHIRIRKQLKRTNIYENHFHNNNDVLIFTGRLQKDKKLDMLLLTIKDLQSKGLNLNLVLVGNGTNLPHLNEVANELGIKDNIWFYGSCYDEAVLAELFYNAKICVSPGSIGLTAIHSLSFGCPVITHNDFKTQGPEFEAIKDGVTGMFFIKDNQESLNNTICNWIINHNSNESYRQDAFNEIDTIWNPCYQIKVLKKVTEI